MTRWLTIALTLIGFTIAMSAVGWVVNATMPAFGDWLAGRLGDVGALILIGAVACAAGIYGYLGHRKAGTSPKGM